MIHNTEAKQQECIEFFRSLDSSERDSFFETIKEEYAVIKDMREIGFEPLETISTNVELQGVIDKESFIEVMRALDSKACDSFFEKMKEEYTEIKELEEIGFKPLENALKEAGMQETTKEVSIKEANTQGISPSESTLSKMKQKIANFAEKHFNKENKKEKDIER